MRSPSYANIVSTLALVVALSGGAYAVTQLPPNSVGSAQVQNGSLKAKDFKPGVLAPGSGVATGPKNVDACSENILLTRAVKPKARSRLLGVSAGFWFANQLSATETYNVDSYLQLRESGAIRGVTAKQNSQSAGETNQRASLGTSGALLDPKTGAPTVLRRGRTYTLELVAHTYGSNCDTSIAVGAAELSYVVLADS
jgi:hypothetical protein